MADLESLNYKSITEMSVDESLERIRQLRLSRRTPDKPRKPSKKLVKKAEKEEALGKLTPEQAAELLKLLED